MGDQRHRWGGGRLVAGQGRGQVAVGVAVFVDLSAGNPHLPELADQQPAEVLLLGGRGGGAGGAVGLGIDLDVAQELPRYAGETSGAHGRQDFRPWKTSSALSNCSRALVT